MSSLTKEQIFKKIIQNRVYRDQILTEEHPNFEQIIKQIQKEHLQKKKKKMDRQDNNKKSQGAPENQPDQSLEHSDCDQIFESLVQLHNQLRPEQWLYISSRIQNRFQDSEIQSPNQTDNLVDNLNSSQIPNVSLNDAQATINISGPAQNESQVSFFLQHLEGQEDSNISQKQQNQSQEVTAEKQNLNLEGSSGESTLKLNQSNDHPQMNITVDQIPHVNQSGNSSLSTLRSLVDTIATNKSQSGSADEEEEEKKQNVDQSKTNQTLKKK